MKTIQKITTVLMLFLSQFAWAQQQGEKQEESKEFRVEFKPFTKPGADTTFAPFQISFVPYIGTNGVNSGNVVNGVSLNVLGGYSAGTESFEAAGMFNINRGDMNGVQLAGLFNQVRGRVDGVQMAGLFNSNLDSVNGVQLAGLTNFTTGKVDGVQISGLANFTPKSVKGVQLAGLMNFSAQDLEGSQISGGLNFTAKEVKGSQVGLFNFGGKVKGFQLGLFNYADSMSGVPVGLISFVRSGYHTLEVSSNEVLPFNLAFRSGKREFYTMLFVGMRPEINRDVVWAFGYGVGSSPRITDRFFLNIEASSEQLNQGNVLALNLINRLYFGAEFQVAKKFAIFAGPTLNFRVYDDSYEFHPELFQYTQTKIRNQRYYPEDVASQMWWGFRAGFRFF